MPGPESASRRVALLSALKLLDFEADPSLDRLARIAASSVRVPIALVTLLSADRQVNKARVGIDSPDMPLADAFCVCALDSPDLLEVADAQTDARFATSRLVTGPTAVRSYAGQPIVFEGIVLGTVCVLDRVPRRYDEAERAVLKDLSGLVSDLIRVRKERLFREREAQRAFECAAAAGEWLWETDPDHRFTWLAGCYSSDTLGQRAIDRPLLDWFGNRRTPETPISALFETEQAFKEALTAAGESGSARLIERSATPYFDPADRFAGYRGTSRDVTDRVRAEIRALDPDAAVRASTSKSEFLSRASHELRTPLNAVMGFAQLLMNAGGSMELSSMQRQWVDHMYLAGRHLLSLVDDMLDLASIERGAFELQRVSVDLHAVAVDCVSLLEPLAARHDVSVRNLVEPERLSVMADRRALTQVLLNILTNAIKYNRPSGLVTVRGQSIESAVQVFVEDNGRGMSDQDATKLFQPFRRLGRRADAIEGSGLGLVICKTLVEQMDGEIAIDSVEDVGTRVLIRLSSAAPAPAPGDGGDGSSA